MAAPTQSARPLAPNEAFQKAAGDRRNEVALGADEKRLRGVFVTDAANDGTAAGFVEGQIAEKILEAASDTCRSRVGLLVGVAKGSGRGGENVFPGLHVDPGVNPERIAGELNLLRDAKLAGRSGRGN